MTHQTIDQAAGEALLSQPRLAADFRCHDIACEVREDCIRWIKRAKGSHHGMSLRTAWLPHSEPCFYYQDSGDSL